MKTIGYGQNLGQPETPQAPPLHADSGFIHRRLKENTKKKPGPVPVQPGECCRSSIPQIVIHAFPSS